MVPTLGARFGNHTSYQSCDENWAFGTPRGGLRTVPIRVPSPGMRGVPRRTIRRLIGHFLAESIASWKRPGSTTELFSYVNCAKWLRKRLAPILNIFRTKRWRAASICVKQFENKPLRNPHGRYRTDRGCPVGPTRP
jgi:hypothetical protein